MRPNEAEMATDDWTFNTVFRAFIRALTTMLVLSRSVSGRWRMSCDVINIDV